MGGEDRSHSSTPSIPSNMNVSDASNSMIGGTNHFFRIFMKSQHFLPRDKAFYSSQQHLRVLRGFRGENFLRFIPSKPKLTKFLTFRLDSNTVPFVKPCGEMTERPKVLAC